VRQQIILLFLIMRGCRAKLATANAVALATIRSLASTMPPAW
jgi:hypothetical protein